MNVLPQVITPKSRWIMAISLCLLFCLLCPAGAFAISGAGSASRGFKAEITRVMASTAASVEARITAMDAAVRELGGQEEVRLFLSGEVMRDAPRPDPLALAWAMLAEEQAENSVSGVPPDMQVHVALRLRLDSGVEGPTYLAALLSRPELLDLYSRALKLQAAALSEYDSAALFFLRPGTSARPDKHTEAEAVMRLKAAYDALDAVVAYLALLPALYPLEGGLPVDSGKSFLPLVRQLADMAPDNYLVQTELARLNILNGGALRGRVLLDRVLSFYPDFAQAYDLRGLCLLWLELPSLALADFSRAINLEPYHPVFFENRALTHRILEDLPSMCKDLEESCRLGECSGLEWGLAQGICSQQ